MNMNFNVLYIDNEESKHDRLSANTLPLTPDMYSPV